MASDAASRAAHHPTRLPVVQAPRDAGPRHRVDGWLHHVCGRGGRDVIMSIASIRKPRTASTETRMASCPDENVLAELVQGLLDEVTSAELELHLDGCAECRRIVSSVVQSSY